MRGARHLAWLVRAVLLTFALLFLLGCPASVEARALSPSPSQLHLGKRVAPTQQPTQQPTEATLPLLSGHISRLYYRKTHPSTNCSQVNATEDSYYFMDVAMYGVCLDIFNEGFTIRTVNYITEVDVATGIFETVQYYHNDSANPNAHCKGPVFDDFTHAFNKFISSNPDSLHFYDNAADDEIVGKAADFVNGQSHFSRDTCFVYNVTIATQPLSLEPDNLLSLDFGVGQLERDGGNFRFFYSSKSLDDLSAANVGSLTLIEAFPLSKVVVYADNCTEVYECLNLYVEPVLITSSCHNNVGSLEGFNSCNSELRNTYDTTLHSSLIPITVQQKQALFENNGDNSRMYSSQTCVSVNTEQPVLYAVSKYYARDDLACSGTPHFESMESTRTCTPLQQTSGAQRVGSTMIRFYELLGGFWRLTLYYSNSNCSGKALLDGGKEGLFRVTIYPFKNGSCIRELDGNDLQTIKNNYFWSISETLPSPSIQGYQILQYLSPGACSSTESQVVSFTVAEAGKCIRQSDANTGKVLVYTLVNNYLVVTRTDYPDNSLSCNGAGHKSYMFPCPCNGILLKLAPGGGYEFNYNLWLTSSCPESLSISLLLSAERVQYSLTIAFAVLSFLGSLFTLLMVLVVQVTDFSILLGAIAVCQAFYDVSFFEPFVPFLHRERNINLYAPVGSADYNTHKWALFASLGFGNAVSLLTSAISLVVAYIIVFSRKPVFRPLLTPLFGAVFVLSFVPAMVWVAIIDSKGFIPTKTVESQTEIIEKNTRESSNLNNFIKAIPLIAIVSNVACFAACGWRLNELSSFENSGRKRRGSPLTELLRRVILYPVIQAITQLPSVVDTYSYQYKTDDDFYKKASYRGFLFYYSVFVPSAGLWFALAFVIVTPGVWRKLTSLGVRARKGLVAALAPVLLALGVSVKAALKGERENQSEGQTADSSALDTGTVSEPVSEPVFEPALSEEDLADLDEQQLVDRHFSSLSVDPACDGPAAGTTSDAEEGKVAASPLHPTPTEGGGSRSELQKGNDDMVQVELAPSTAIAAQTTAQTTTLSGGNLDLDLDNIYGGGEETGRFSSLQLSGRDGEAVSAIRQGVHVDDIPGRLSLNQAAQQHVK